MTPSRTARWQMHACVVLWGFTAILGKAISLRALPLVCWRMLFVSAVLGVLPRVRRGVRALSVRLRLAYAGVGVLVAVHWLTFYASIKLANASVGATCMALAPVFLAVVEPLVARRRFDPRELALAVFALPGVALVVGGIPGGMRVGVLVGTLSAFLVAVFGACNKRLVSRAEPLTVTFLELGAGALFVTVCAFVVPHAGPALPVPSTRDALLLLALSLACTILPFTLSLVALRHLSAAAAQLIVNIEPVYAIALAALLFGEQRVLGPWFYVGVAIILAPVFAHPWIAKPAILQPESLASSNEHVR